MNGKGAHRATYGRSGGGLGLTVAVWSAPGVALMLGVHALQLGDVAEIGPFGLVSALHPELCVALAVLTAAFLSCLLSSRSRPSVLLAAHVVVLVVLLFGAAAIIEPLPRMTPGWLHVGFADYIARTGRTLPELDARFSWPGFFALAAMATRAAGMKDAMPLLGWAPVVLNLLYGAVVFRLARATSSDRRSAWLAVWLFFPANWVGQDYFAPQGLNYLFYLVLVTVLLVWFRPPRFERIPHTARLPRGAGMLRALRLPATPLLHEPTAIPADRASLVGLIGVVLVVFTASTASHQLTPVAIVLSVGVLVVVGRCTARSLPVLLGVILAGYISYLTVPYWSGHMRELFGSFGNIGGVVSHGTSDRISGDEAHQTVVLLRVVLALAVWALAAIGAWRRMRRGHGDLGLLALAGAPFLLVAMNSYGGEIFLRVYAFALAPMAVLLAAVVVPVRQPRRRVVSGVMMGLMSAALMGAFVVARYGNERFEQVRQADVQAVGWLYSHAPPGASFVAVTSNVPWRSQAVERYKYQTLDEKAGPADPPAIEAAMRHNPRGSFLILTEGQYVYAEAFLGKPRGWGENIERQLIHSGRFRLVYANQEAKVYVLAAAEETADGPGR